MERNENAVNHALTTILKARVNKMLKPISKHEFSTKGRGQVCFLEAFALHAHMNSNIT